MLEPQLWLLATAIWCISSIESDPPLATPRELLRWIFPSPLVRMSWRKREGSPNTALWVWCRSHTVRPDLWTLPGSWELSNKCLLLAGAAAIQFGRTRELLPGCWKLSNKYLLLTGGSGGYQGVVAARYQWAAVSIDPKAVGGCLASYSCCLK